MGRAPCCEKFGLKKGPWSEEEDHVLVSFIHKNGHGNWRSLPKRAGLLRCGKSCRLRWTNYLRPDIKRGNFTKEEEDTIIRLHETLGNRWAAIAAELPGRTDNEIKNVWHTHLKKRLLRSTSSFSEASIESQSTSTTVEPQPSSDLSLDDFLPSEWPMPELEESIWSEEFTVPWSQSLPDDDHRQQVEHDDDMDFWMNMLIEGDMHHV